METTNPTPTTDLNSNAPPPAAAASITVLLVDDQAIVGEAVRRLLASEPDMTLRFCSDPSEAVAVANQILPTIILQDLVMPNLNGLSLVRRFRANPPTKTTPIIVLTSKESPMFKHDAAASGANDYLVKLPTREVLVGRIREQVRAAEGGANPLSP